MTRFILNRLGQAIAVVVACTVLVFAATEATPGSVVRKILGPFANEQQVEILKEVMRLNDPAPMRYLRWAGTILGVTSDPLGADARRFGFRDARGVRYFGNLGFSTLYKKPVNAILWERLRNSAMLAAIALLVILPLSMGLGILCGVAAGSRLDRIISLICVITTAIPEFAWGVGLIAVFVIALGVLPGTAPLETSSDWSIAAQLVMPVLVLVLVDFGYLARMVRTSVAEVMGRPFIRTAVLKGLARRRVVLRHALRNAMIAPLTAILLQINFLITGVVVTEVVFAYPGFGRMLLEAALFGDIALIEGATIVAVMMAIVTQFVGDIGYMMLDPRIRVS